MVTSLSACHLGCSNATTVSSNRLGFYFLSLSNQCLLGTPLSLALTCRIFPTHPAIRSLKLYQLLFVCLLGRSKFYRAQQFPDLLCAGDPNSKKSKHSGAGPRLPTRARSGPCHWLLAVRQDCEPRPLIFLLPRCSHAPYAKETGLF